MFYSDPELQIEYLIETLDLNLSKKILDVGCNDCTHLLKLEDLGYKVIGIDLNNSTKNPNIIVQNIFEFEPNFNFDCIYHLALQLGNNYNRIELLLKKYFEILDHNGLVVLDFMNYHSYLTNEQSTKETEFLIKNYHKFNDIFLCNAYNKLSGHLEYYAKWKILTKSELEYLCQKIGFEIISIDFDFQNKNIGYFEPRELQSQFKNRLTVVLKKV
jgi:SAM-dependent methyltransferase